MMNDFKNRIRNMLKRPKEEEKGYNYSDLEVRQNVTSGDIAFYRRESVKGVDPYTAKRRAINIEDESDVVEYTVNCLPGGRVAFGKYISEYDSQNYKFYDFMNILYHIYGKVPFLDRKFTRDELLKILQEIREKTEEMRYEYLYEIKYKDSFKGRREFKGAKYFGGYIEENAKSEKFELIDSGDIHAKIVGDEYDERLIIMIRDKTIETGSFINGHFIAYNPNLLSPFEIKEISSSPISRMYDQPKFTLVALREIVREYERGEEGRYE